ncbi:hypothetical protein BD410DRAFT_786410 [Rickenella mellea]|uniref:Uncharacterized protein n=1 Tax=Rickenella mellea TaxID=50990 RepID=A0A4Y7QBR5_9AGAM|nr:hypothetical protein BD410DRAFT_786410 [Rickenella mellea]
MSSYMRSILSYAWWHPPQFLLLSSHTTCRTTPLHRYSDTNLKTKQPRVYGIVAIAIPFLIYSKEIGTDMGKGNLDAHSRIRCLF